jgi:hypothetical protein
LDDDFPQSYHMALANLLVRIAFFEI